MVHLEKTRWHVYYLYDYVKPDLYDKYDNESIERSKKIWAFKSFDDDAHERLSFDNLLLEDGHHDVEQQARHGGSEHGADDELLPHGAESDCQQNDVDGVVDHSHIPAKSIVEDWGQTNHTAGHHLFGQDERREAEAIANQAENNHHVVTALFNQLFGR